MNKKINWRNVSITILAASNLILSIGGSGQQQKINELESDVYDLKNELVSLDEEAAEWYSLYKYTLNDLYMLQVETGLYNESSADTIRNPNTINSNY